MPPRCTTETLPLIGERRTLSLDPEEFKVLRNKLIFWLKDRETVLRGIQTQESNLQGGAERQLELRQRVEGRIRILKKILNQMEELIVDYSLPINALEAIESASGLDGFIERADVEIEPYVQTPTGMKFMVSGFVQSEAHPSGEVYENRIFEVENDGSVHSEKSASLPR